MQIVLNVEELQLLPDDVREGLLRFISQQASPQSPKPFLEGFLGDGSGQGNRSLLYAGVAARDGECCAQCGDDKNLEINFIVPINVAGGPGATIENAQLLCRKHHAIKQHKVRDLRTVGAISVEAAITIIEGLNNRSANLLRAIIRLGKNAPIERTSIMNVPDLELSFKNGRSLNGVLTAIRKRFRSLVTEAERNSVNLLEYDDVKDTYSIGEGTSSSIEEAFKYFDDPEIYSEKHEINLASISMYRQGLGTTLHDFSFGGPHSSADTVLVLPTLEPRTDNDKAGSTRENFNFSGAWVIYGPTTKINNSGEQNA